MSTCIHNNYQSLEFTPHNTIEGSTYFDTRTNKMRVYVNGKWVEVKGDLSNKTDSLDEFDLITNDGFVKVILYQEIPSGDRGVLIYNEDGKELIKTTEECIKYIKDNLNEKSNLFVEKRILNHLG